MSTAIEADSSIDLSECQYTTFHIGTLLLGVDIRQVQEINCQLNVTVVPQAPLSVRGVINLRGEVTTVMDLRTILGLTPTEVSTSSRNLIVHVGEQTLGLLVDNVSDIVSLKSDHIDPTPANVEGIQSRFFHGVHSLESEILVLLNLEEVVSKPSKEESTG